MQKPPSALVVELFQWLTVHQNRPVVHKAWLGPSDSVYDYSLNFWLIVHWESLMPWLEVENPSPAPLVTASAAEHFAPFEPAEEHKAIRGRHIKSAPHTSFGVSQNNLRHCCHRVPLLYYPRGPSPLHHASASRTRYHQLAEDLAWCPECSTIAHSSKHSLIHLLNNTVETCQWALWPHQIRTSVSANTFSQTMLRFIKSGCANANITFLLRKSRHCVNPFRMDS